jgi:hypothetical protein
MLRRLKNKWKIKSNWQLIVILAVFAITGSSAVLLKKAVFILFEIDHETHDLLRVAIYLAVMIPGYFGLLFLIGSVAGQYRFFSGFIKKTLLAVSPFRTAKSSSNLTKPENKE